MRKRRLILDLSNRLRVRLALPFLIALILLSTGSVVAQKAGCSGAEAALAPITEELRPQFGRVRFHREEKFEDFFDVRGPLGPVAALMPRIYLVEEERYDVSSGTVIEKAPTGLPTKYVAVSADGKSIYRLAGFNEAEQEFNRLLKDGPEQKIRTKGEAESRGLLCAEIVYGLPSDWWLSGASSVKLKAAEHFLAEGHADGLLLGDRWWKSAKGDRSSLQITTARANGAFSLNIPVFWAPVEGHSIPEVQLHRINIAEDGSCLKIGQPVVVLR